MRNLDFRLTSSVWYFSFNLTLHCVWMWSIPFQKEVQINFLLLLILSRLHFTLVYACCVDFVLLCTPLPGVQSVWASSVCRGSVMLSTPLSERSSAVLRLTNVGPLSETRFTPFEVLTPSSAASPTLLTQRLFDMKSVLKFFCTLESFLFGFRLHLGGSFPQIRLILGKQCQNEFSMKIRTCSEFWVTQDLNTRGTAGINHMPAFVTRDYGPMFLVQYRHCVMLSAYVWHRAYVWIMTVGAILLNL